MEGCVMARGKQWSPMMDGILLKWYADEESTALARQFGYGVRTIERHAAALGLKKSQELIRRVAKKGSDAALEWIKRKKENGEKIQKRWRGGGFEKGHRWDPETEARRVEAIRKAPRPRRKDLELYDKNGKFVVSMLKRMRTDELQALLKEKMSEVYAIRRELDRREGEKLESVKASSVNFEEYVTK